MSQYLMLLETEKEKEFFQTLYDLYSHEMYYVSYAILQNSSDAEDIVHDTFVTLTNHLSRMMNNPPHKNWNYILTIVKNKSYNLYKRRKREIGSERDVSERGDVFSEGMDVRMAKMEQKELFHTLLKKMRKPYQEVLILQYYHELDVMEIAEILDKTPDNVRHISMRAKKKLQSMLEEYGFFE